MRLALNSLWFVYTAILAFDVQAQEATEVGTRIGSALAEPNDDNFRRVFQTLSFSEQNEIIRILTTDMQGWSALERVPLKWDWARTNDEQKKSLASLLEWMASPNVDKSRFDHLRFVTLAHKPFELKLRYEKLDCYVPPAAVIPQNWKQKILAWNPFPRAPAAVAPTTVSKAETNCEDRNFVVALSVDPGNGGELVEKTVMKGLQSSFARQLDEQEGLRFRQKVWENIEIVLADLMHEMKDLPPRLRVIEVAGGYKRNEFLERRKQVILLRNESNQASARHEFPAPAKLTE